jgi:MFS family permease
MRVRGLFPCSNRANGVDAFAVNVAIPTIAAELQASPAQIEAVIAIYLIGYATLAVTGGGSATSAAYFSIEAAPSARLALFAASALFALSIIVCAAFLSWMRRAATRRQLRPARHNPGE